MRTLLYVLCCGIVIGSAYWAYKENYQTQASIRNVADLQTEIAKEREAISVLNAEWAYLNRPERLRDLVDLNFADLELLPLLPEHFADVELVAYPQPVLNLFELEEPVSVQEDSEEYP
ncbi:MAG: cell division protein FtsL [Rhodobacteraceae bacterium]|nr:cell division protein FtsL [Paracoccaceae bacterium]